MYGYPVKTTELVAGKSWGAFEQFTWFSTPVGKIKVLWVGGMGAQGKAEAQKGLQIFTSCLTFHHIILLF